MYVRLYAYTCILGMEGLSLSAVPVPVYDSDVLGKDLHACAARVRGALCALVHAGMLCCAIVYTSMYYVQEAHVRVIECRA